MPLLPGKSKKAFSKNVETEMKHGKPQDQALAIAYSIKRKNKKSPKKMAEGGPVDYDAEHKRRLGENQDVLGNKKGGVSPGGLLRAAQKDKEFAKSGHASYPSIHKEMAKDRTKEAKEKHRQKLETIKSSPSPKLQGLAEGGEVNAKNERRPMPDNRYDDSKMISRNSGNKPPKDDSWTSNVTIKQAQKPSITKLSQPRIVGSDAFSVRNRDMHDDEADMMDRLPPESDLAQPPRRDDEEGANRQGPDVRDMQDEHSTHRKPYNKAIEDQYAQDIAAAEMKKVQSYARGGMIDSMNHPSKHDMEPADSGIQQRERSDEAHLMDSENPSEDEGASDARSRNEERPNRQGDDVPDMEEQHNSGRKPYYMGGPAVKKDHPHLMFDDAGENEDHILELNPAHDKHSPDDSEDQPEDEESIEHEDSIAAAIMSKKQRGAQRSGSPDDDHAVMMADGGILSHDSIYSDDSDQADLSRNADEDANEEDQLSFNALRKENYSESAGLKQLDSPDDSAQHDDNEERDSEDSHDKIDKMRNRMNMRRQFKQR